MPNHPRLSPYPGTGQDEPAQVHHPGVSRRRSANLAQAERAAFELHLSGLATISPPASGPSPAGPGAAGGSRPS